MLFLDSIRTQGDGSVLGGFGLTSPSVFIPKKTAILKTR